MCDEELHLVGDRPREAIAVADEHPNRAGDRGDLQIEQRGTAVIERADRRCPYRGPFGVLVDAKSAVDARKTSEIELGVEGLDERGGKGPGIVEIAERCRSESLDRHDISDTEATEQAPSTRGVAIEDCVEHEFDLFLRTPVGGDRAFGDVRKAFDGRNPGHICDERRTLGGEMIGVADTEHPVGPVERRVGERQNVLVAASAEPPPPVGDAADPGEGGNHGRTDHHRHEHLTPAEALASEIMLDGRDAHAAQSSNSDCCGRHEHTRLRNTEREDTVHCGQGDAPGDKRNEPEADGELEAPGSADQQRHSHGDDECPGEKRGRIGADCKAQKVGERFGGRIAGSPVGKRMPRKPVAQEFDRQRQREQRAHERSTDRCGDKPRHARRIDRDERAGHQARRHENGDDGNDRVEDARQTDGDTGCDRCGDEPRTGPSVDRKGALAWASSSARNTHGAVA